MVSEVILDQLTKAGAKVMTADEWTCGLQMRLGEMQLKKNVALEKLNLTTSVAVQKGEKGEKLGPLTR